MAEMVVYDLFLLRYSVAVSILASMLFGYVMGKDYAWYKVRGESDEGE